MQYILVFYSWSRYRCVPNVISQLLSPVVWKVKMAEDDIAFLLNRWELVEPHEIKQSSYYTSANIKIFFLVQYSNDIWKNHILTVLITLLKKRYLLLYNKRAIAWILVNIVPRSVSYCIRTLAQYDKLLGILKYR